MIIVAIDHNDFERSASESLGGRKSTKPCSNDDDPRARHCFVETGHYRVFRTLVDAFRTSPSLSMVGILRILIMVLELWPIRRLVPSRNARVRRRARSSAISEPQTGSIGTGPSHAGIGSWRIMPSIGSNSFFQGTLSKTRAVWA